MSATFCVFKIICGVLLVLRCCEFYSHVVSVQSSFRYFKFTSEISYTFLFNCRDSKLHEICAYLNLLPAPENGQPGYDKDLLLEILVIYVTLLGFLMQNMLIGYWFSKIYICLFRYLDTKEECPKLKRWMTWLCIQQNRYYGMKISYHHSTILGKVFAELLVLLLHLYSVNFACYNYAFINFQNVWLYPSSTCSF